VGNYFCLSEGLFVGNFMLRTWR